MSSQPRDIWIMGYGNPGRGDDGLGPALAESLERMELPGVTVDSDYQLTVEDAAEASKHEIVLFADADATGPEPFSIKLVSAEHKGVGFSSHGVDAEGVLAIARDVFGAEPTAYLIGIRGYAFDEFCTELSDAAKANLDAAVSHVQSAILNGEFKSNNLQADKVGKELCKTANT